MAGSRGGLDKPSKYVGNPVDLFSSSNVCDLTLKYRLNSVRLSLEVSRSANKARCDFASFARSHVFILLHAGDYRFELTRVASCLVQFLKVANSN